MSAEESMESDLESCDSDKELQVAFARGLIKPGLNFADTAKPHEREYINNVEGLTAALDDMKAKLPWLERLDMTVRPLAPPAPMREQLGEDPDDLTGDGVHDDFKREMKFYRLAQAACMQGIPRLQAMGIPTRRPEDYFAEMVKTDVHMKKVRQKLVAKQIGADRSEKAKKMRDLRKYGKKVQVEVLQKRQKEKKEMLESVKKYRKGQESRLSFLDDDKGSKAGGKQGKEQTRGPNKAREFKNKKFGFGGQKKRGKYNTKKSASEVGDFSARKHSNAKRGSGSGGAGPGGKGKGKGGNKNRPGKARRQKSKSKK